LIEEAFQEACTYQQARGAQIKYERGNKPIVITADRPALKYALTEVFCNAVQASEADAKISVRVQAEASGNGLQGLQIEVEDNGAGFTPEAAQKAPTAFFTTRNVGLGLGLTVARKIVEMHGGTLEIIAPKSGQGGVVRIALPLQVSLTAQA
jgi:nitrogen fixation/metabolism regulation signal transduction histidine kinase